MSSTKLNGVNIEQLGSLMNTLKSIPDAFIDRPKFLAKSLKKKIKTLQMKLSKKKKGSL